jgi:hypothetical protein
MPDGKLRAGGVRVTAWGLNQNPSNQDVVRAIFDETTTRPFASSLTFDETHYLSVAAKDVRRADLRSQK